MSRQRTEALTRAAETPEERRARDVRRGFVLVHAVLSGVLVLGAELGWYSLFFGEKLLFHVRPLASDPRHLAAMPFGDEARWFVVCAVVAFFFTSYDLIAGADIQWPALLASAFALGLCGHVSVKLDRGFDRMVDGALALDQLERVHADREARTRAGLPPVGDVAAIVSALSAPVGSNVPGSLTFAGAPSTRSTPAPGSSSSSTAVVSSAASNTPGVEPADPPVKLKVDLGLKLCLFASASMTLLSAYLTFFARRAP